VTKFVICGAGIVMWVGATMLYVVSGGEEAARCGDEVSGTVFAYITVMIFIERKNDDSE